MFDFKIAPFPKIIYPEHINSQENTIEEARCLKEIEKIIENNKENSPIAGMIVEPIGNIDNAAASHLFYKKLRQLAKEHDITFIGTSIQ